MEFSPEKHEVHALITGGSSGLGAEFANQLALKGFIPLIVGRRVREMRSVCQSITENCGIPAYYYQCNLSDDRDLADLTALISQQPSLRCLVNNAGYSTQKRFLDHTLQEHRDLCRTHMDATVALTHACLETLIKNNGILINVASIAAMLPTPVTPLYGSTKAFIKSFTSGLISNYSSQGLRGTTVCPGFIQTDFHSKLGLDPSAFYRNSGLFKAHHPAEVVKRALTDAQTGKLISIHGWNYKLMYYALKHCPDWLIARLLPRVTTSRVNDSNHR